MFKPTLPTICLALALGLFLPAEVLAYLDPGSGSMIFQTIVATLAGVAYGVRVYWGRIRGWFGSRDAPPAASSGSDPDSEQRGL